jgi:hypothetical protein
MTCRDLFTMIQFFIDVYKGRKSLAFTWWVMYCLVPLVLVVLFALILNFGAQPIVSTSSFLLEDSTRVLMTLYRIYISLAVVNCVYKQSARGLWSTLAIIFAIIGLLVSVASISITKPPIFPYEKRAWVMLQEVKDRLVGKGSYKVDDVTLMEDIALVRKNKTVIYKYKLLDSDSIAGLPIQGSQKYLQMCNAAKNFLGGDFVNQFEHLYTTEDGEKKVITLTKSLCRF